MTVRQDHVGSVVALGRSSVRVTRSVFGTAPIGGLYRPVSEEEAHGALAVAWDAGVRAFDTAPHYGVGQAEQYLGDFLRHKRRQDFVVSTKVGRLLVPTDEDVDGAEEFYGTPRRRRALDYSAAGARRSVEESCARMGLDHVDVALVHDPEEHFVESLEGALPALAQMRAEGTVGAIGVGMNQAGMPVRFVREFDLDCVLVAGRWSLLDRSAGEALLPLCAERGVGVLVGSVFNSGILAAPSPDATYNYAPASPAVLELVYRLQDICAGYGAPLRAAALQFPLRHPAVTAVAFGARDAGEAAADVADLRRELPEKLWAELEDAVLAADVSRHG